MLDNRVKSLLDTVQKDLTRAQRDNDLIYHNDIPATTTLSPIPEASLAAPTVPPGLLDPKTILGTMQPLFDGLIGWGAREAIGMFASTPCLPLLISFPGIYNERKQTLVRERLMESAHEQQFQVGE